MRDSNVDVDVDVRVHGPLTCGRSGLGLDVGVRASSGERRAAGALTLREEGGPWLVNVGGDGEAEASGRQSDWRRLWLRGDGRRETGDGRTGGCCGRHV